ncbi:hypothetical protein PG995_008787 [Apiospora arundinis]
MALQDPPGTLPWKRPHGYQTCYMADCPLTEEMNPSKCRANNARDEEVTPEKKAFKLNSVCFLISDEIDISSWSVDVAKTAANMTMLAVLRLQTNAGELSIINFHNPNQKDHKFDFAMLPWELPDNNRYILLGDSNMHHPLWGGDHIKPHAKGGRLLAALAGTSNMTCLNTPGTITWSHSDEPSSRKSSIDVCFAGSSLSPCDLDWFKHEVDGINEDHFVFATTIRGLKSRRNFETRFDLRNANWDKYRQMCEEKLRQDLGFPPLLSPQSTEEYGEKMFKILCSSFAECVPERLRIKQRDAHKESEKARHQRMALRFVAQQCKRFHSKRRRRHWIKKRRARLKVLERTVRIDGLLSFQNAMCRKSENPREIFVLARRGRAWCQPRPAVHIGTLHDDRGAHVSPPSQIEAVLRHCYPDAHGELREDCPRPPPPPLPPSEGRCEYESSQKLEEGELLALIKGLKSGKAPGVDNLPNEAIKMIDDIFLPYGEHLFTACIIPGYTSPEFWINIGIPQGSPLSTILFLIFAAPLLHKLQRDGASKSGVEMANFAFADDGYFVVSSDSYETNNRIIEELHKHLLFWANENGASFSPEKYGVMHFQDPRKGGDRCELLPKIAGLGKSALKLSQRILGIIVDYRLQWDDHIDSIQLKVQQRMKHLQRISGNIWGPPLREMLQLYKTMIRPLFATGCAAWFLYSIDGAPIRWGLRSEQVKRLIQIEDRCLLTISGAFKGTAFERLESPVQEMLYERRKRPIRLATASARARTKHFADHPYEVLDCIAHDFGRIIHQHFLNSPGRTNPEADWSNPKKRKQGIKKWFDKQIAKRMDEIFDLYIRERANRQGHRRFFKGHPVVPRPQTLSEPWSTRCIKYCKDMDRAESTMYMQLVSGKSGLNGYLSTWATSPGQGPQTVDHLFFHCTQLASQREELKQELGHLDLGRMLTKDALVSTQWALEHFPLEQFQWSPLGSLSFYFPETFLQLFYPAVMLEGIKGCGLVPLVGELLVTVTEDSASGIGFTHGESRW